MDFVNLTIRSIGERYASGGFFLVGNKDPELASRTPKLRPKEVVAVPVDHWLNGKEEVISVEKTDKPPTRPFTYPDSHEAQTHAQHTSTGYVYNAPEKILAWSKQQFEEQEVPKRGRANSG